MPGCKNNEWEFVIIWVQKVDLAGRWREREAPFWSPSLPLPLGAWAVQWVVGAKCLLVYCTYLAKLP